MRTKICYVVTIPGTFNSFFISQLNFLSKKEFDVTVICSDTDSLSPDLSADVKRISVPIPRGLNMWGMLKSIIQLCSIFRKEKFKLIQYSTPNAALCAALASFFVRSKIRNYHLMGFRYLGANGLGRFILKQLERLTCALSTSIECVSKSNLKLGVQEGIFPEEKATVVWNGSTGGVDMNRFDVKMRETYRKEIRDMYGVAESAFVFGYAGRITRDKGINEILEVFQCCENAKLMMVGAEENIDSLDKDLYSLAKNTPDIIWTGSVSDIERYFAAFDFLLLPSYREGFGNVIIEAAAMGTPAIVSNIPGPIDAIKENVSGYLIEARNTDSLLAAMHKAKENLMTFEPSTVSDLVKNTFDHIELNQRIYWRKLSLLRA